MSLYRVEISSAAQRGIERIPPRYSSAVVEFITRVLPQNPQRMGKPLREPFEGVHSARRGDYRILYRIREDDATVLVVRVEHRATVYRLR